jgi:hypothetical protein
MKKYFWPLVIAVILAAALGLFVGRYVFGMGSSGDPLASPYAAVYLSTGDIYYGKISWTPAPHLTDVWYLQKSAASNGAIQYGIEPFKTAVWGPVDEIYFNQANVIFWTYLASTSPVVQAIENPSLFQQMEQQLNQTPPAVPVPVTSTPENASGTNGQKK